MYSLDGSNPSKLLTSAIGSRSTSATLNPKDEDFYLGLLAEDGQVRLLVVSRVTSRRLICWVSGFQKSTPSCLVTHLVAHSLSRAKKARRKALKSRLVPHFYLDCSSPELLARTSARTTIGCRYVRCTSSPLQEKGRRYICDILEECLLTRGRRA